jgi:hypothetical protein
VALLTALAEAMRLAPAEVYEVASFYHHFDVQADGEAAPPSLTVRVCESLSCTMAGAGQLLAVCASSSVMRSGCSRCLVWALRRRAGGGRRPAAGACASPAAVAALVAQAGSPDAAQPGPTTVRPGATAAHQCPIPAAPGYVQARAAGAYEAGALHADVRSRESVFAELERAGLCAAWAARAS